MKISLYNLYKQVILESVDLHLVQDALNNNWGVKIVYNDGTKHSSSNSRWCQILAVGKTSKGHDAVRVYQVRGPNLRANPKTGKTEQYKTFRLDRIEHWGPTKFKFYSPPDGLFNTFGDKTLNVTDSSGNNIAKFGDKYMDNYRERHANWQSNLQTKQQNEPLVKGRADSENNPVTKYDYNHTPYEKPVANQPPERQEPEVDNNNDYPNDEDNPNDENI
jgi:hypothetical protein